jgi:hypothetical protein
MGGMGGQRRRRVDVWWDVVWVEGYDPLSATCGVKTGFGDSCTCNRGVWQSPFAVLWEGDNCVVAASTGQGTVLGHHSGCPSVVEKSSADASLSLGWHAPRIRCLQYILSNWPMASCHCTVLCALIGIKGTVQSCIFCQSSSFCQSCM